MFSDIIFLWRNRERPTGARRWLTVWAKRAILLLPLVQLLVRPAILRLKGAQLGRLVTLGKARINGSCANLAIGDGTSLGRCEIALHAAVKIGRSVVINDGAVLLTASHSLSDPQWRLRTGVITIGDYAWIATNAIILPNVNIGKGAVVGAGSVVSKDVPDFVVVAGNPAIAQRSTRSSDLLYSPALLNAPFEAWVGHEGKSAGAGP
jgi:acetyltransferase-like isoleucine patch superfamily enzyme